MGDEIRQIIKSSPHDNPIYASLKLYVSRGRLINDGIAFAILSTRLQALDTSRGLLIDGYPRTLAEVWFPQAEIMTLHNEPQGLMVHIKQDPEVIMQKLAGRRVCDNCHANFNLADVQVNGYHLPPQLPKVDGICDFCGGNLVARKDDNKKTIQKRMFEFNAKTLPLEEFYRKKGRLLEYTALQGVAGYPDFLAQIKAKLATLSS